MDPSERIDIIRSLRDELDAMEYEDAELVLAEYGIGSLSLEDWQYERWLILGRTLRQASDDDLISLASHFSSEELADAGSASTEPGRIEGPLRLFASHQSNHKQLVSSVARALQRFGVGLFVAHEDIEPDREWKDEILRHLAQADGGVAFLHSEFKTSDWCSQEVGWLLGRGVPVISLKFDIAPYGPLGERQAIPARGRDAADIASDILGVAESRADLLRALASSYVEAMSASPNFSTTDSVWLRLRKLRNLDGVQCERLLEAAETNTQIYWANSPHDGGRSYKDVIPDFIQRQPGSSAVSQRINAQGAADESRASSDDAEWDEF